MVRIFMSCKEDERAAHLPALERALETAFQAPSPGARLILATSDFRLGMPLSEEVRRTVNEAHGAVFVATWKSVRSAWCQAELGALWGQGIPIVVWCPDGRVGLDQVPIQLQSSLVANTADAAARALRGILSSPVARWSRRRPEEGPNAAPERWVEHWIEKCFDPFAGTPFRRAILRRVLAGDLPWIRQACSRDEQIRLGWPSYVEHLRIELAAMGDRGIVCALCGTKPGSIQEYYDLFRLGTEHEVRVVRIFPITPSEPESPWLGYHETELRAFGVRAVRLPLSPGPGGDTPGLEPALLGPTTQALLDRIHSHGFGMVCLLQEDPRRSVVLTHSTEHTGRFAWAIFDEPRLVGAIVETWRELRCAAPTVADRPEAWPLIDAALTRHALPRLPRG